jgi:hypothetical protein
MSRAKPNPVELEELFTEMFGEQTASALKRVDLRAVTFLIYVKNGHLIVIAPQKLVLVGFAFIASSGIAAWRWIETHPDAIRRVVEWMLVR